jgi:septum formation protein
MSAAPAFPAGLSIILASASARRAEILRSRGAEPLILPSDVDESIPPGMNVRQTVMYLALKKALHAEEALLTGSAAPVRAGDPGRAFIVAADTLVYKDRVIGKPSRADEAYAIFELLRNTDHQVYTGVAILRPGAKERRVFHEVSRVFFTDYSLAELKDYVDSGQAYDKAGGYAAQGEFSRRIRRIEGRVSNVIGLPVERLLEELADMGTDV